MISTVKVIADKLFTYAAAGVAPCVVILIEAYVALGIVGYDISVTGIAPAVCIGIGTRRALGNFLTALVTYRVEGPYVNVSITGRDRLCTNVTLLIGVCIYACNLELTYVTYAVLIYVHMLLVTHSCTAYVTESVVILVSVAGTVIILLTSITYTVAILIHMSVTRNIYLGPAT